MRTLLAAFVVFFFACAGDGASDTGPDSTSTGEPVTTSTSGDPSRDPSSSAGASTGGDTSSSSGDVSTTEPGTTSSGSTSTSSTSDPTTSGGGPVCGDGIPELPELCDDGGETVNCDGDCSGPPVCGDGYTNPAALEECDDGNAAEDDGCLPTCVAASCGDGHLFAGEEECDDGNDVNGDGCSASCKVEKGCGEAFTTSWCKMNLVGKLDQYTRCGSINDEGTTCNLPEIRYGTNEKGRPIRWKDEAYMETALTQWCQSLGFATWEAVEYGDGGTCLSGGPVVWSKCCDENEWHWIDYGDGGGDGKWYPPNKLNEAMAECPAGDRIVSVTCGL